MARSDTVSHLATGGPARSKIKITDLKCAILGTSPVVRITTSEGISGYGEAEERKSYDHRMNCRRGHGPIIACPARRGYDVERFLLAARC